MSDRILRLREVMRLSGLSRSTIYARIGEGLFPQGIPLGVRMVGWLESEVASLNAARVRGATETEIRRVVEDVEAARKTAA